MRQSPSNRIIIKGLVKSGNDSRFCLWVWEAAVSWMSLVLRMLSSPLGLCVGVVPAGSREGETPLCPALYVVPAQRTQTGEEKGARNVTLRLGQQAWAHSEAPMGSPVTFAHLPVLMQLPLAGPSRCSAAPCQSPRWRGTWLEQSGLLGAKPQVPPLYVWVWHGHA